MTIEPGVPTGESLQEVVEDLAVRAEASEARCVDLSYLSEVVQELDLAEEDAQTVQEMLEERGIDVRDDCGPSSRADQVCQR